MMRSRILGWLLVLVVPGVILSAYLYASRTTRVFSATSDYSALAASIAVGLLGIFILVRPPLPRVAAAGLYVVLAGGGMYLSMLKVVCVAFRDCI